MYEILFSPYLLLPEPLGTQELLTVEGGVRVKKIVQARRHIGAFLLPQSKVSYVQKGYGRGRVGG